MHNRFTGKYFCNTAHHVAITVFACPYSIVCRVRSNLKRPPIDESVVVFRDGKSEELKHNQLILNWLTKLVLVLISELVLTVKV